MTIYLDHAASTPVRPEARDAYLQALDVVGNPSSVHRSGQAARGLLEDARVRMAQALGADPIEVIFTSGGTESINLAVRGMYRARHTQDERRRRIVMPAGEHHATLDPLEYLATTEGAVIDEVPLDTNGRVNMQAWADTLAREPETIAFATALWVNNEVGTIQDVAALHQTCADVEIPLHCDAVAAFGHQPIDISGIRRGAPDSCGLVAVSVSGHKVGAVPGSGALVVHRTITPEALILGGGQERGLRSGTPAVPSAVSLGVAATLGSGSGLDESERLNVLRHELLAEVSSRVADLRSTVAPEVASSHIVHLTIPGCSAESLIFLLDREGIAVSAGSACQAGVSAPSHVVRALGGPEAESDSVLRVSIGYTTTAQDIEAFARALPAVVEQARGVRGRA